MAQGMRALTQGSPRLNLSTSTATMAILSAIAAFTGFSGTPSQPKVTAPSVMLWATVNAVMVLNSIQRLPTSHINPSTNSR